MRLPPATKRTASRAACTRYPPTSRRQLQLQLQLLRLYLHPPPRAVRCGGRGGGPGSPRLRVRIYRARHEIHCPVTSLCRSPSALFACTTGATSWGTRVQKRHRVGAGAPPCGYSLFGRDNCDNGLPQDCRCPSHRGAVDRRNTKRGDATQRTARRRVHCVRLRGPQNFEDTGGVSSRSLLLRLRSATRFE